LCRAAQNRLVDEIRRQSRHEVLSLHELSDDEHPLQHDPDVALRTADLWALFPTFTQRLATSKGERRQIGLPDGSHIDLNTDTDISIAFYDTRRTVELHRGEALFSISHDIPPGRSWSKRAMHACWLPARNSTYGATKIVSWSPYRQGRSSFPPAPGGDASMHF